MIEEKISYESRKEKLPKNVKVYENTQVNSIDYGPQTHICVTENGEIRARQILLCNAAC